jgi:RNA polymerase sigma factor (sigma-70 family)
MVKKPKTSSKPQTPDVGVSWDDIDPILEDELGEDGLEDFEKILENATPMHGYTSPFMAKLGKKRLTIAMLEEEIPILRASEDAASELAKGVKKAKDRRELQSIVTQGDGAKERLFAAALPLIRTVAHREWRRRQQWGSQVPFEDLLQEAIIAFFKGLASFRLEAIRTSPTNYLGQWMLMGVRRSSEVLDHDLQVGHDQGERFRRVRALRSRLIADLGRDPTDEEIADASRNPNYVTRPSMIGRVPPKGESHPIGKGLTIANVADERQTRSRVGHVARFVHLDGDENSGGTNTVDSERLTRLDSTGSGLEADPADIATDAATAVALGRLIEKVITQMRMPDQQQEIIARRFGLHPHEGEASAREISRAMGIHRERITRVLSAFNAEMTRKGGIFHEIVGTIPQDDLLALGLGWVTGILGPWDTTMKNDGHIATILTDKMKDPVPAQVAEVNSHGVLAWFQCDYHDRIFSELYLEMRSIPKTRPCPMCQKDSSLIRTSAPAVDTKKKRSR